MTRWLSEMTGWGPYNGLKIWGNSDEYAPFSSDMGSAGPYFRCKRCLCWQYTDFRSNIFGIFVTISVILITGPNKWYGEASKYCSYTFCNVTLGGSCPHDPIGPPSMKDKVRTSNRYGWSLKSQVSSLKSEVGHQVRLLWSKSNMPHFWRLGLGLEDLSCWLADLIFWIWTAMEVETDVTLWHTINRKSVCLYNTRMFVHKRSFKNDLVDRWANIFDQKCHEQR